MNTSLKATLAASFLFAASSALALSPTVLDLGLLPGDAAIGPAPNSQLDLAVAQGGDQFLVAWSDSRPLQSGSQTQQSDVDIFGIRLDSAGNPIDAAPFLIAGGMGYQRRPHIAWNGENWLVLYESQEPTQPPVTYYETLLRAARVAPQGQLLDPTPIAFPPDLFDPATIGLTITGQTGQWLVTRCIYHDDGYGTFLAGQRIDSAGVLLDPAPVMLNDWVYGNIRTLVANGEYLVVGPDWNNASQLKARRIDTNLQPVAASFNLPAVVQSIAGNGSEFYITWIANFTHLVGSRMTSTGTLLNPSGTLLIPNFSGDLATTHDGANWWIAWTINQAKLMRISPTGTVLDPDGVTLPITVTGSVTSLYSSTLAPRPSGGVLYAWADYRAALGTDANVFAIPVSPANSPASERCLSTSTKNQRQSHLCEGPNNTSAIAYISELANDDRVLVNLLDSAGIPTLPSPIEVAAAASISRTEIAWNGSLFLVAFDSPTGIQARRLNPDGSFIDPAPFQVMNGFYPTVGALGQNFLIAASRFGTNPQIITLWGNRIDGPTGAVLDGTAGIVLGGGYVSGFSHVRADNDRWLVASFSHWTHDSSQSDAFLTFVPPAGPPTGGNNPTPFSGGTGDLDIAFSGSNYLLVWRSNSLSNANNYISGRIMNLDGSFATGAFTIAEAAGRQLRPTVAWDGSTFIVAWDDQRNQASFYDTRTDVYAARVSLAGSLLDPAAFPIFATSAPECSPSLLATASRTLVSSSRFITSAPFDSYRIGLSAIGEPPCPADLDDGTNTGTPDNAVDINDLLFFLVAFEQGSLAADLDNGSNTGTQDNAVDINDLLYFLVRFEAGC